LKQDLCELNPLKSRQPKKRKNAKRKNLVVNQVKKRKEKRSEKRKNP
jgi:hypothetical protein